MSVNAIQSRPDVNALLARMREMRAGAEALRSDTAVGAQTSATPLLHAAPPATRPIPGSATTSTAASVPAGTAIASAGPVAAGPLTGFGAHLARAIEAVNTTQKAASAAADGLVRGEHGDLVGVMVAAQKSSVAFTAAVQVRNRLVSAYENIMNMPI